MPINCSTSVLSGKDGSIAFKFAGTELCLLDKTDFITGTNALNVFRNAHDFRVGDPVSFKPGTRSSSTLALLGNLDSELDSELVYFIGSFDSLGRPRIVDSDGVAVSFNGDGGIATSPPTGPVNAFGTVVGGTLYTNGTYNNVALTGGTGTGATANITVTSGAVATVTKVESGTGYTALDVLSAPAASIGGTGSGFSVPVATITATNVDSPTGDIRMSYAEYGAVCNVRNFSVELTREELDSTSLPCGVQPGNRQKYANFQSAEPGYVNGSGTMEVFITSDRQSVASRLRENSLLKKQDGAFVRLFVDTIANAAGDAPDLDASQVIEAPIRIMGFSATVDPAQNTTATIQYKIIDLPTRLLTLDLTAA